MRRIYTLETQLAKLKDDLRLQRKENQEDKEKIKKLEQLINNNNDYRYTTEVNSFLCPGIKNNGKRCTRTINCHWYQNYLDGNVKNAHKKIKQWENFEDNLTQIIKTEYKEPMTPLIDILIANKKWRNNRCYRRWQYKRKNKWM